MQEGEYLLSDLLDSMENVGIECTDEELEFLILECFKQHWTVDKLIYTEFMQTLNTNRTQES